MIASNLVYLIALIPFCLIWISIFIKRPDLRKEILVMSFLVGLLSVVTSYYWWTIDWWKPLTLFGTKVGVEDFIMGFTSGGIMASLYEVFFKKTFYKRKIHHHVAGGLTILLILAQTTSWLFYEIGLSSFWASTVAMSLVALIMIVVRRDLFLNAVLSGVSMLLVSLCFYWIVMLISSEWISQTYYSGIGTIKFIGIPMEELIFWFLAGLVFGPFYEYWQGEKLCRFKS